jgi:hypothetical protein
VHDSSLEIYGAGAKVQDRGDSSLGIWDTETGKELVQMGGIAPHGEIERKNAT